MLLRMLEDTHTMETANNYSRQLLAAFYSDKFWITVNAEGHARAHDPRIDTMRMSMTPDLGIFAPLKMPCAWPKKIQIMRMRIYPKNKQNFILIILMCKY